MNKKQEDDNIMEYLLYTPRGRRILLGFLLGTLTFAAGGHMIGPEHKTLLAVYALWGFIGIFLTDNFKEYPWRLLCGPWYVLAEVISRFLVDRIRK